MSIQLDKKNFDIVKQILNQSRHDIFVFGSRAKGKARKLSDSFKDHISKDLVSLTG